jgi:DnaD/phage-associated family protein
MTEHDFNGFPDKAEVTPVPNLFFSALLPKIKDISELKLTLYILWVLSKRRGYPRMITHSELVTEPVLKVGLVNDGQPFEPVLEHALELALERGTLLVINLEKSGKKEKAYLINSESERRAVRQIECGELALPDWAVLSAKDKGTAAVSNIFTLYEQNIGMITPLIAEELKEAESLYPADWIAEAMKEAVTMNKRNWKYISRILERWKTEGKADGEPGTYSKKQSDTGKYIRGRYGHLIEH